MNRVIAVALASLLTLSGIALGQEGDEAAKMRIAEKLRQEKLARERAEQAVKKAAAEAAQRRVQVILQQNQIAFPVQAVVDEIVVGPDGGVVGKKDNLPTDPALRDQSYLRSAGLPVDPKGILDYFKRRTLPEANPKMLSELVVQLGDEEFQVREKAFGTLAALGAAALPAIKDGLAFADTEVRRRSTELKSKIEANAEPTLQQAAARVLARAKTPGMSEVLLAYLPMASDVGVVDEICRALGEVAVLQGKADAGLVKALQDKQPLRRAAAGEAFIRAKSQEHLPAVRGMLKDGDRLVRLRVGLALAYAREKASLPVLVDLLGELPAEQLSGVEEILFMLAQDQTPSISLGTDEASRKACRDAWAAWLAKNEDKIDLAKLVEVESQQGFTLICQQQAFNRIMIGGNGPLRPKGEIVEIDREKKVRWKIEIDQMASDVQFTREGTVLVAEYQTQRVTERETKKGDIVWQIDSLGGMPICVQRLASGNTFIATQSRLLEVDRQKKVVFEYNRPSDVMRAKKLLNGDVAFVTNSGTFFRIEPKNKKVLKSFHVGNPAITFGSMDVLPNGHVLVPEYSANRVVEFNSEGRQIKAFPVSLPNGVQRLPNGNTFVVSQSTRRLIEFDREGREVWSHMTDGLPYNARRR